MWALWGILRQLFVYKQQIFFLVILYIIIDIMKRTFQPNKRKRAKDSGFRKRNSTSKGRKVLKARRMKGRKRISSSDEK